jgi:hypothetical protein
LLLKFLFLVVVYFARDVALCHRWRLVLLGGPKFTWLQNPLLFGFAV